MITRKAYAKINLALDVTGRRENGYHEVSMIMQSVDMYDELSFELEPRGEDIVRLTSPDAGELSLGEDNLIIRAARALYEKKPWEGTVHIELSKHLPVAAGMAGGSTDCAATFEGINELLSLGLSKEDLCILGGKLGADVPFCIMGGTVLAEGIGTELTRLSDCPTLILAVAKPKEGVSTKLVYESLDDVAGWPKGRASVPGEDTLPHPDVVGMKAAIEAGDTDGVIERLGNVLELVTIPLCDPVAHIKSIFAECGAKGVLMSGSGPTVFAVFEDAKHAQNAVDAAKNSGYAEFGTVTTTIRPK